MKKTYIAPRMEDVTVKVGKIICSTTIMSGGAAAENNVTAADTKARENIEDAEIAAYINEYGETNEWDSGLW